MASEASNNGPTPAGGSGSDTIPLAADAAGADVPETQLPADSSETIVTTTAAAVAEKWPGWPGDNVFRLIIPVLKVGGIIGRKGELIKKMCEETRARIRVLDAPTGTADRVVLISGKEEPDSQLCPAMDAALKVFKRVTGLSPNDGDKVGSAAMGAGFCCIKLLIASSQAISLIGKQGSTIRSIQESSGASIRVLSEDEVPSYATSDERVVDIQGESIKVLKALEAVLGHLRKFLVDHSVIPIFEKTYNATISQDHAVETKVDRTQSLVQPDSAPPIGTGSDYSFSMMRDPYFINRDARAEPKISHSALSVYGQDPGHGALRSTGLGRMAAPIVTQMTQTMQVPLSYAEDIIGIGGANIAYIRRTSGAILTVQEGRGLPDEITVEIKGTSSQVQMAQQLIQDFISNHKEPASSIYGDIDTGLSSYSQLTDTTYAPSSFQSQPLGGYGSSAGLGGYGSSASMGGYGSGSSTSIGGYGTSASMGGYGSSSSTSIGGGGYNTYRF